MEKTKLPNKKEEHKGSFPTKLAITIIIAIIGTLKYQEFKSFIKSVRFRVVVNQKQQQDIITYISPLIGLNIPYEIESIELFLDQKIWKVKGADLNKKIVSNSHIPIMFKAFESGVSNSQVPVMAVNYSLYGFYFKVCYQPEIIRNENIQRPSTLEPKVSRPKFTQKKSCKCQNKHMS
ncbi:hypothetical protein [Tenacibaculum aiptasiae]|uniref:hypothetical protein n=1 Tax=Tenacibaculum aiptasiae TaxID=426481 RepID=UPI0023306426|nr:hypothetical protein [Tenacibaculum aiptasiae]